MKYLKATSFDYAILSTVSLSVSQSEVRKIYKNTRTVQQSYHLVVYQSTWAVSIYDLLHLCKPLNSTQIKRLTTRNKIEAHNLETTMIWVSQPASRCEESSIYLRKEL